MRFVSRMDSRRPGFTLIEILVVFTLIGILVALGIPNYSNSIKRGREAVLREDLFLLRKLLDQYKQDKGKYPPSLETLVEEKYLRAVPPDPITKSSKTWIEVRETPPADEYVDPSTLGVIDVKSGAEGVGVDKTPYSSW